MGDSLESYRFICRGCHVRYTHGGQCQICGSEIVVEAEWPTDPAIVAAAMATTSRRTSRRHGRVRARGGRASRWRSPGARRRCGEWCPARSRPSRCCSLPSTSWRKKDAGEELGDYLKAAPFDGHAMQDGRPARQRSRPPLGCRSGAWVWSWASSAAGDRPHRRRAATVVAGIAAMVGFLLAWIRRHWRRGRGFGRTRRAVVGCRDPGLYRMVSEDPSPTKTASLLRSSSRLEE